MWSRTYRNHFIMAFPSFDTTTLNWRAQADISWCREKPSRNAVVLLLGHADAKRSIPLREAYEAVSAQRCSRKFFWPAFKTKLQFLDSSSGV